MSKVCVYCQKKPVTGNKVSHSNMKTKIRHLPNLQKVRAFLDGIAQRVYVCTRCLRSGKLAKPLARKNVPLPGSSVKVDQPVAAV